MKPTWEIFATKTTPPLSPGGKRYKHKGPVVAQFTHEPLARMVCEWMNADPRTGAIVPGHPSLGIVYEVRAVVATDPTTIQSNCRHKTFVI